MAYVKGVTYVTYFADWGDTLFEIHNWDLENSDTFDKCNKVPKRLNLLLKVMNINVFGRVQYFADYMCDMYDMFDRYIC